MPRIALTIPEAALALGVSTSSFRRYILPDLKVVNAGPRLTLVRLAELDKWAERREGRVEW